MATSVAALWQTHPCFPAPLDAMKNPVDAGLARETYQWTAKAFHAAGAPGHIHLVGSCRDGNRVDQYLELLS